MHYLLQQNFFRGLHLQLISETLDRLSLEYEKVSLQPSGTFDFKTERKDVFCFGSSKFARITQEQGWQPGSLMNGNHDYTVYAPFWTSHLLNWESVVQPFSEDISFGGREKFIRPTRDSKIFTGQIFRQDEWEQKKWELLRKPNSRQELIQIAPPRNIYKEIRCWIVNGKVISASTYIIGGQPLYQEYSDRDGLEFAEKMVERYQPATAFVLDICLTENGWKIVEVNCINGAGFYACNLQKLVLALEDCFG